MMEEVASRPCLEYIPPGVPPKVRQKKITSGSTTFTQITSDDSSAKVSLNGYRAEDSRTAGMDAAIDRVGLGSMHSFVLNSTAPSATVFVAANRAAERDASIDSKDTARVHTPPDNTTRNHVVTIRINTDDNKRTAPVISSVRLKNQEEDTPNFNTFKNIYHKKNNSLVRINADESLADSSENDRKDKPPFINCNTYPLNSITNSVMSSGQCSPSDTLDSGTCSDLDGTPPPLPKKKSTKTSKPTKNVTVTKIGGEIAESNQNGDVDFEDNDSNISCDSLNSSEFNGSVHTDEHHSACQNKKEKKQTEETPAGSQMPSPVTNNKDGSFLPQGLLQDIRDRSPKLNNVQTESESRNCADSCHEFNGEVNLNTNANGNLSNESARLTSFRLVSRFNEVNNKGNSATHESLPANVGVCKMPLIRESTYEDRMRDDKMKQEQKCVSGNCFDTDKYFDFHLNEKQFENINSVSGSVSVENGDVDDIEYFCGIKDYNGDEAPSTIRSSKGTVRGVKNRVRAGIATFLQMQSVSKSYREKDAGKVVLYTTTMGIVRTTYQRCAQVKKILRNLLVKYEERDIFMSTDYQDEIRERMKSEEILVPQLFIDGYHVGDADTVEKLNESGELRKMLKPYKSPDACNTCQMCGGFRLLPCRICNGSKKSLHRNHFTAEFVALKCMNCDEVGLVRCESCS